MFVLTTKYVKLIKNSQNKPKKYNFSIIFDEMHYLPGNIHYFMVKFNLNSSDLTIYTVTGFTSKNSE